MRMNEQFLRASARKIFRFSIKAVDPFYAIRKQVKLVEDNLWVGRSLYRLKDIRRILVIGAGKASAPIAQAVEKILGSRIHKGIVVTKKGYVVPLKRIELVEGGHPLPDKNGMEGTRRILKLISNPDQNDLVICLISGGGSSLLVSPSPGISLKDKKELTDQLLRCGADIEEINTIRKHISQVKGGRLAQLAYPSYVMTLILSDVIGSKIDSIASGPTAPDTTTFSDCLKIIQKYKLKDKIPPLIYDHLKKGRQGKIKETPKLGDPIFKKVRNFIIGSNSQALEAAKQKAELIGFNTMILSRPVSGDTTRAAVRHANLAKSIQKIGDPVFPPACLISGGETTVKIKGKGLGGRNQEFILVGATKIAGLKNMVMLSAGTDGTDGPTDAAGAICNGKTIKRALQKGLNPKQYLDNNDSYHFFQKLGDLLKTGPTNTNVMDIHLILVGTKR
ncbi:MAG: glycerate kinase [Candidatus Zixiibacteriota bacterium]